jgi:hypothetical protein
MCLSVLESFRYPAMKKCRNIEARELARRLVMGETVTRQMASSDEVWALVRNSALGVAAAANAKLIETGVSAEKRRAWLQHQHARIEAIFANVRAPRDGSREPGLPPGLIASLGEVDAATDASPWNVAA